MIKIKKFLKQGLKPILYVIVGFILGVAIYTAQAAWNTTVAPTDPLTAELWNDVVAKLVELDLAIQNFDWGGLCVPQTNGSSGAWSLSCNADEYLVDAWCSDEGGMPDCTVSYGWGGSLSSDGSAYHRAGILCCQNP